MAIEQKKIEGERSIYEILQIVSILLIYNQSKRSFLLNQYNIVNELNTSSEPILL